MNESGEGKPGEMVFPTSYEMDRVDDSNARHERSHVWGHNRNADEMHRQMSHNAILQTFGFGYEGASSREVSLPDTGVPERPPYGRDSVEAYEKAKVSWDKMLVECSVVSGSKRPRRLSVELPPGKSTKIEWRDELQEVFMARLKQMMSYEQIEEDCRVLGIPTNDSRGRENSGE